MYPSNKREKGEGEGEEKAEREKEKQREESERQGDRGSDLVLPKIPTATKSTHHMTPSASPTSENYFAYFNSMSDS